MSHELLFQTQTMDILGCSLQSVTECLFEADIGPVVDQISCIHNFRCIEFSFHRDLISARH